MKEYFEHIPSLHRSLLLAGGILFFYGIEYIIPYLKFSYSKPRHALINIFFTVTTILINFLLAFLIVMVCDFMTRQNAGFLNIVALPLWLYTIAGLLLLDLVGAWLIHFLQHKIKWMWKFHIIHHADQYVDTTTANRHHPGESVFRLLFTLVAVFVTGAPFWLLMLYQALSALLSQFNHANISLPDKLDKWLSYIIVSPNMHKVHHHYIQPYTDSNYANIFSIWDRIFGTFKTLERDKLVYGLDTHMLPEENSNIKNLLSIPFQPYRATGSKFNEQRIVNNEQ